MFRNVQTEIVIASDPHRVREKADACAHRHSRVGMSSVLLSMPRVWRNGIGS